MVVGMQKGMAVALALDFSLSILVSQESKLEGEIYTTIYSNECSCLLQ